MREPLIPRDDWLADSLNALFLRRVWRPAAGVLPDPDAGEVAVVDRPEAEVPSGICEECGNTSTGRYCGICSDPKRERATIMVVSDPATILQAEASGYRDVYHVHSPGAGGIDQMPFSVSGFRLQDRLRRYRATKVILRLGSEAEEQDQQRRLQEELEGLGYSVSFSPSGHWTAAVSAESFMDEGSPEDPGYRR